MLRFHCRDTRSKIEKNDIVIFDERKTRKVLRLICCLRYISQANSIITYNKLYVLLVYIFLFLVVLQGMILAYITNDIVEKVESIHYTLCIIIIIAYISNELYNSSNLDNAWKLMKFAFETFNEYNEENRQLHIEISSNVIKSNKVFCFLMSGSCIGYLLFAPMRQLFALENLISKKLPVPLYFPFDTSKNLGFITGMLWEGITLFYICGVATSVHQSFRGIMGRLRGELNLLNKSIKRIHVRAVKKYGSSESMVDYSDINFRSLIFSCLREDIIHHQMLKKYYSLTRKYLGTILLLFIFLSSIILAAVGFLITRPNGHMEEIIKFLAIVSAELFFVYQLCWEGERVAEESGEIFRTLFNTTWYHCDKNFRASIVIMLCGTMKPIRLTTNVFNVVASLETYNSVITTSFQYFNLLRNIKST